MWNNNFGSLQKRDLKNQYSLLSCVLHFWQNPRVFFKSYPEDRENTWRYYNRNVKPELRSSFSLVDPLCVFVSCHTIFRVKISLILSSQSHEACYYMKRDSHITDAPVFFCLDERVFLTPEESVTASPIRAPERPNGERRLPFHRWYQRIDSQRAAGNAVMSLSGPVKLSSEEEHQLMQKWQNELGVCSEVIVSNSFTLHLLIRRTFSHQVCC